jgi:tripartite-type tricarboxylate transporter receptor subunit TctC
VPTLAEAGVPGVSVPTWQAVLAPPKTPREIVDRLAREVASALQGAELRSQFDQQLLQIEGSTPQALAALIQADTVTWQQFVRESGIQPE